MSSKSEIAAPAVHVDKWKRWSFAEGRSRCRITLPEGLALTKENGHLQMRDLITARVFDLPALPPDEMAWFEANRESLSRNQTPEPRAGTAPTGYITYAVCTAPFNAKNNDFRWFSQMQAFCGISRLQQTLDPTSVIYAFPGLQSQQNDLLQPTIEYNGPSNVWVLFNNYFGSFSPTVTSGTQTISYTPGIAYWLVIRHSADYWRMQSFRGNSGNTGADFRRPVTGSMAFYDPSGLSFGPFTTAVVAIENGSGSIACASASMQAVFGGLTLLHGIAPVPINWIKQAGVSTCLVTCQISGPKVNPYAQITLTVQPN